METVGVVLAGLSFSVIVTVPVRLLSQSPRPIPSTRVLSLLLWNIIPFLHLSQVFGSKAFVLDGHIVKYLGYKTVCMTWYRLSGVPYSQLPGEYTEGMVSDGVLE